MLSLSLFISNFSDFLCLLLILGDASENIIMEPTPQKSRRDPLLQLVSLQKASDCWVLDPDLAAALGKTSEEVEISKPTLVGHYYLKMY